jgi:hypothetical protein
MEAGRETVLKWYCSFPALRDCAEPAQLPVDPVKVSDVNLLNLGLGRSIYSKEQMEDFARFQDSQNTRKAYLAAAAELAYLGRSGGEWGCGYLYIIIYTKNSYRVSI